MARKNVTVYTIHLSRKRVVLGFEYPPYGKEISASEKDKVRIAPGCWAIVGPVNRLPAWRWHSEASARYVAARIRGARVEPMEV